MRGPIVGLLCLAFAACASPTATPSNAGGPAPTPASTTSPAALVSQSPSTSAAVAPTAGTTTVTVPLGGAYAVVVTVEDQSGWLVKATRLVLPAGTYIPYGDKVIAAWNPAGEPSTEVWLYWGGVICDVTSRLVIGPGAASMTVTEGPRPACDASNDGRGLVLTFAQPVDATGVTTTFVGSQPTQ